METISKKEQKMLIFLSDIFIDNIVEYPTIALKLKSYSFIDIEAFFINYIIPICAKNSKSPIPYVWGGFSEEYLFQSYLKLREKHSPKKRISWKNYQYTYLKWRYSDELKMLEKELMLIQ